MDKPFTTLYEFINSAARNRKYPENTANGLKAALKLFEAELNEEEKGSIKIFSDRLEQIYPSVFSKNQQKFSAGSLATYKSRVFKVLGDYQKYGVDPTKMVTWTPQVIKRTSRKKSGFNESDSAASMNEGTGSQGLAPARTLRSGIQVRFPAELDVLVNFGDFGTELKSLDNKAITLLGENNGGDQTEDSD